MSALVKELLIDLSKLSTEVRCDLLQTIKQLYIENVISSCELCFLDLFAQGYSAFEIALQHNTTTERVQQSLTRILKAIEAKSHYFDIDFVHKVEASGKYSAYKVKKLIDFLQQYSETF